MVKSFRTSQQTHIPTDGKAWRRLFNPSSPTETAGSIKTSGIDTSIDGFRYVGINLTEQQYEDLRDLNILFLTDEHRKNTPVFNTMVLLRILGLLPPEMVCDVGNSNADNNTDTDINEALQRKFGKYVD